MTRVKTTTQCSISKANVKNKTKEKTEKKGIRGKACLGGCIKNVGKAFGTLGLASTVLKQLSGK